VTVQEHISTAPPHNDIAQAARSQSAQCGEKHWPENRGWQAAIPPQAHCGTVCAETVIEILEDVRRLQGSRPHRGRDAQTAIERHIRRATSTETERPSC
jgi:hypothetical protein